MSEEVVERDRYKELRDETLKGIQKFGEQSRMKYSDDSYMRFMGSIVPIIKDADGSVIVANLPGSSTEVLGHQDGSFGYIRFSIPVGSLDQNTSRDEMYLFDNNNRVRKSSTTCVRGIPTGGEPTMEDVEIDELVELHNEVAALNRWDISQS